MISENIIDKFNIIMKSLSSTERFAIENLSTTHWKKNKGENLGDLRVG